MTVIELDDRERDPRLIAAFRAADGVELRRVRLPSGDIRVDGHLLIERKTSLDFLASLRDGRLFSQVRRMTSRGGFALMILEGSGRELMSTGMSRESIQGALITISLIFQVPVLRSLDPEETARLSLYAGRQLRRQAEDLGGAPKRIVRVKRRAQLRVLRSLPGVGAARARRLLDALGTVSSVVAADLARLAEVDGIGERTASGIRWVLEEAAPAYGHERAEMDAGHRVACRVPGP